jgi:hypothetical protein
MTSAIAKRNLDSFLMFNTKEFVSGYQPLVTIQPLNKSKKRGWFIRSSDLDNCRWTAKETDFEKGSVIFNYEQMFGMPPNTAKELGINFQAPRVQVLLRSPLMVEEQSGQRQTIGTFEDEDVKELFDADRTAAELANSKNEMYKRKYSVRTKYLIYILDKNNKRAHQIPIVLTLKGLNGTDVSEKIRIYEKEMSKCYSKAIDSEIPLAMNEKFYATTVFCPTLSSDMRGSNNVEICAVESFDIPDEDRESTWKFQEMYYDYINQHSSQDAKRLDGKYGIKKGVNILPVSRDDSVAKTIDVQVQPSRDSFGADNSF